MPVWDVYNHLLIFEKNLISFLSNDVFEKLTSLINSRHLFRICFEKKKKKKNPIFPICFL